MLFHFHRFLIKMHLFEDIIPILTGVVSSTRPRFLHGLCGPITIGVVV
jgi:hypothetical protein